MARTRKTWETLSPTYRRRLEKAGYTRKDYLAGKSRAAARGHSKTPERPSQAIRNPRRYPDYVLKRDSPEIRREVAEKIFHELIPLMGLQSGDVRGLDIATLYDNIMQMSPATFALARNYTIEEWRAEARYQSKQSSYFYVGPEHRTEWIGPNHDINPFWYH